MAMVCGMVSIRKSVTGYNAYFVTRRVLGERQINVSPQDRSLEQMYTN
jgi:hypothetical protein